ncbi:nucleotidyltransferase family protein [Nitrosopumilus sp.]|uniref:nucleotidyltransferase family protein n=1 Tax=Nitrosopumilus sp. TaxID=2024843 RepID=UPI002633FE3C|nr:nucleotidyltransferase family protein [Nitrosopumilus sp.]
MKAIILAGGKGTRLRPITDYVPKPLIPINNTPIIEWQIKYLKRFGVKEVIICTGYKTEMIENYLNMKNLGVKISFSIENSPLGTGGAIKKASKLIKEKSFFVINGDVITNIDLKKLSKINNSIAAIEVRTKFGILDINKNKIKNFKEKKEISDVWMNAGLYHLDKDMIKDLPVKGDIEKTTFPNYAKKEKLSTVIFRNVKWYSIDSFKDMEEASLDVNKIIK